MNPRRKKRLLVGAVLLMGLSAFTAVMLTALSENIDLFFTPGEIINGKKETGIKPSPGQRIRIGGMVVEESVERDEQSLKVSFVLTDASAEVVKVYFDGILPDLFREGQGIVAQGYVRKDGAIDAFEVLAKHDEEYMPPDLAEAMKGIKHEKPKYTEKQLGQY